MRPRLKLFSLLGESHMTRWFWRSLMTALLLATFSGSAYAQGMGSIFGKVTDSSGARDAGRHRHGDGHGPAVAARRRSPTETRRLSVPEHPDRHLHGDVRAPGLQEGHRVRTS